MSSDQTAPASCSTAHPLIDRSQVGARLRGIRKDQKLTLKQLSERSGVALSTLSKMELAQVSVSYEKLAAAARALGVDIAQLFSPVKTALNLVQPTVVSTAIDSAAGYSTGNYDYHPMAGDFPGRRMTPMYARIFARELTQFDDYIRHPGQEFAVVLSGRVRIQFETGESISIGCRETAYFNSGIGHIYLAESEADAEVMVVMTDY
ncbi:MULTISPECIES: helix-turn-helix domain-containing protein [Pseudomonas]|jgi:transcriptional regulator with XRE-family HTH domain|uniref:helix-turn-helix domain-containing protein n=1 Tax=Pseudomonas TaxID=286 RepID=UPI00049341EA|nr:MULTISPECIES: XRE family transcriptional regulator [Pseudomonas]MDF3161267.1 XRE family transcriptional regulator [Pseudomonas proteolytica]NMZ13777.1 helix-turn-helix domain-containing protein [Pseudomonas proteolytica]NMZ23320.1 helix-turn-helix domain-containing protein [Pseudomonas proteolytica]NMZ33957.1 helix-turn-helix domain-containing protein [Pseudomonas proteolytica]NMZ39267.1 helix-turn-helix domain-containing protein [Pseudomonas proteolytica]